MDGTVCGENDKRLGSDGSNMCHEDRTFAEAQEICAIAGARMCTAAEVAAKATKSKGCKFNRKHIWTSTACDTGTGVSGFITQKGKGSGPTDCAEPTGTKMVSCCSDAVIDTAEVGLLQQAGVGGTIEFMVAGSSDASRAGASGSSDGAGAAASAGTTIAGVMVAVCLTLAAAIVVVRQRQQSAAPPTTTTTTTTTAANGRGGDNAAGSPTSASDHADVELGHGEFAAVTAAVCNSEYAVATGLEEGQEEEGQEEEGRVGGPMVEAASTAPSSTAQGRGLGLGDADNNGFVLTEKGDSIRIMSVRRGNPLYVQSIYDASETFGPAAMAEISEM